jgi:hypothetical protein
MMSIKVMTAVWDRSVHSGAALLLMLAIADFVNDDGAGCWASVNTLAGKVRMHPRSIPRLLTQLERSGELSIVRRPGRSNLLAVNVDRLGAGAAGGDKIAGVRDDIAIAGGGDKIAGVGGDIAIASPPDIAIAPDPSLNQINKDVDLTQLWDLVKLQLVNQIDPAAFRLHFTGSRLHLRGAAGSPVTAVIHFTRAGSAAWFDRFRNIVLLIFTAVAPAGLSVSDVVAAGPGVANES